MTDANCMRLSVEHAPHGWSSNGHPYQCDGTPVSVTRVFTTELPEAQRYEIPYEKQLQAQALHTVFTALGGLQVFGFEGAAGITVDDTSSVRQTQRHVEPDGKKYLYTTNVTVSVSRVEVT